MTQKVACTVEEVAQKGAEKHETLAMSIPEACQRTGFGRTTIYAAIKSGALVARKCGRRTVILSNELSAFVTGLPHANAQPHQTQAGKHHAQ
jgi:excisionase family DNA binding protein